MTGIERDGTLARRRNQGPAHACRILVMRRQRGLPRTPSPRALDVRRRFGRPCRSHANAAARSSFRPGAKRKRASWLAPATRWRPRRYGEIEDKPAFLYADAQRPAPRRSALCRKVYGS